MQKQLSLFKEPRKKTKLWWAVKDGSYGGDINYRKVARPFDKKKLTHAIFSAELDKKIHFTRSKKDITKLIDKIAGRCEIKIMDVAINHDHIHIFFYTKFRENQTRFLRLFAAEMGRIYKRIKKRFGLPTGASLWIARPFTRLVSWGVRARQIIHKYFEKNRDEAAGLVSYTPRKHRLNEFLRGWKYSSA